MKAIGIKSGAVKQLNGSDRLEIPNPGTSTDPSLEIGAGSNTGFASSAAPALQVIVNGSFSAAFDGDDLSVTGDVDALGGDLRAKAGKVETLEVRLLQGANYVGFAAPNLTANQIWVLPAADGDPGDQLQTDGLGNLSWQPAGGGVTDHGSLTGLADDDHPGHPWLTGRAGGQTLIGGVNNGDDLILRPNSVASPTLNSWIYFGVSSNSDGFDAINRRLWSREIVSREKMSVGLAADPGLGRTMHVRLVDDGDSQPEVIRVEAQLTDRTVSDLRGVVARGSTFGTTNIGEWVGFDSQRMIEGASSTLTTAIGFRARQQVDAATAWSFYSDSDPSWFGGLTHHNAGLRLIPSSGLGTIDHIAAAGIGSPAIYAWPLPDTAGHLLSDSDGSGALSWVDPASLGDNLGDHTMTQGLEAGTHEIGNIGQGGLQFDGAGAAAFSKVLLCQGGLRLASVGSPPHVIEHQGGSPLTASHIYHWPAPSTAGFMLTDTDGAGALGWTDPASLADNLGDHTMTENLQTAGFYLSNDGTDAGILLDASNFARLPKSSIGTDPSGNNQLLIVPDQVNQFAFQMTGYDGAAATLSRGYFWNDAGGNISIWLDDLANSNRVRLRSDAFSFFRDALIIGGNLSLASEVTYPAQVNAGLIIGAATVPRFRMDSSGGDSRARNWELTSNTYDWSDLYLRVGSAQGVAPDTRVFSFDHEGRLGVGDAADALNPTFFLDGHASTPPTGIVRGRVNNFGTVIRSTNAGFSDSTWEIYCSSDQWRFYKYTAGTGGGGADVFRMTPTGVEIANGTLIIRRDAQPVVDFREGASASLGLFGMASSPDDLIVGSEAGDYGNRVTAGSLLFSTDAGATLDLKIDKTDGAVITGGEIEIQGGTPAAGKLLRSTNASGRAEWAHLPDETIYQCSSTADFSTTPLQIPLLVGLGNDRGHWTLNLGDLEAAVAIARADIQARVLIALDALANNQEVQVTLDWVVTTTGGTVLNVRGVFPFQTSRAGTWEVTIDTSLSVANLAAGDTIRLTGVNAAGYTANASVVGGLVWIDSVEQ